MPLGFPPMGQAVAGKFSGIAARAKIDMRFIAVKVINTMRNDLAFCVAGEVMIEHFDCFLRVKLSLAIEVTQQLLFLGVDAD